MQEQIFMLLLIVELQNLLVMRAIFIMFSSSNNKSTHNSIVRLPFQQQTTK
jgi:hypothetical protein